MTIDELLQALQSQTGTFPTIEQRSVMEYNKGPLRVIAGPGTGKTYALILRCLRLLCVDHIRPENIVLTTFTHKAAEELKQRLVTALLQLSITFPEITSIDPNHIRLGTLHSLCWDILTETPGSPFRHLESLTPLDRAFFMYTRSRFCRDDHDQETTQRFLQLASWIENNPVTRLPYRWDRVRMFDTMYERLINDYVDCDRFAASSPSRNELVQLIEEYKVALEERSFTDQTLMQHQALEVLCSPGGQAWTQNIVHVIVDEYQDTNPLQAAIYRALASTFPHHLCIVGDDDQALHRFRGGTVACMIRFPEQCTKAWSQCSVKDIFLTETYRSHPSIVQWINAYITIHPQMSLPNARVREKIPLHAQPHASSEAPVVWAIRGKTTQDVARSFVEVISSLKEQGIIESFAQCALLAYSLKPSKRVSTADPYIRALREKQIPVTSTSLFKDQLVYKQILGTILIALDRAENLRPRNFATSDGAFARYIEECREIAQHNPVLANMADQIRTWMLAGKGATTSTPLTTLGQALLNAPPCMEEIENAPVAGMAARSLIKVFDSYDRVVNRGWKIQLEEIQGRKRVAKTWMGTVYYVLLAGIHQNLNRREEDMEGIPPTDALSVMTIHRAKGLEYPVVAVVVDKKNHAVPENAHHLEQDTLPFQRDRETENELMLGGTKEERALQDLVRRHYVAYSRAQSILLLLMLDEQVDASPPSIGLGTDATWIRAHIQEYPPRKGAKQLELL